MDGINVIDLDRYVGVHTGRHIQLHHAQLELRIVGRGEEENPVEPFIAGKADHVAVELAALVEALRPDVGLDAPVGPSLEAPQIEFEALLALLGPLALLVVDRVLYDLPGDFVVADPDLDLLSGLLQVLADLGETEVLAVQVGRLDGLRDESDLLAVHTDRAP